MPILHRLTDLLEELGRHNRVYMQNCCNVQFCNAGNVVHFECIDGFVIKFYICL